MVLGDELLPLFLTAQGSPIYVAFPPTLQEGSPFLTITKDPPRTHCFMMIHAKKGRVAEEGMGRGRCLVSSISTPIRVVEAGNRIRSGERANLPLLTHPLPPRLQRGPLNQGPLE